MKESFWAKVLFREFTAHFIAMTPDERAKDIEQSIIALTRLDSTGNSFGSKMVGWANERMESKAATASAENGRMGGRPPKNSQPTEKIPASKNIVINWAIDNKIDPDDAGECWEATKERNWRDADGNAITNWKAFVKAWCKTRKENRK